MQPRYTNLSSIEPHPDYPLRMYYADEVDTRIALLERALHQIKNSCVDEDDKANEWYRLGPAEIRKIAVNALAGITS